VGQKSDTSRLVSTPEIESRTVPFVRVLGPIQVVDGFGNVHDAPSATQRRLLAILAVRQGNTVRSDTLAELLGVSVGALRQTVARIRTVAGADVIQTDPTGYQLGFTVDAELFVSAIEDLTSNKLNPNPLNPSANAFADGNTTTANAAEMGLVRLQSLESALAFWRGNALDEFSFEPWAQGEATRLNELRDHALCERIELLIGLGRFSEAIADAQAQIAVNPLTDRPRGLLIRALAAAGRQTEALRAYQSYRDYLAEEAGTEPSVEVRHIEQRVATGWNGAQVAIPTQNQSASNTWVQEPSVGFREPTTTKRHTNLPVPTTNWIGNRERLAHVAKELPTQRLVTLTGSGGVGKTRSAIEIARICLEAEEFPDGVLLFELAAITNAGVLSAVASSLSVQAQNNMSTTEAIVDWLQGRSMLLIFDNCEHVLESIRALTSAIINGVAAVTVLATSRERLGIRGERTTQIQLLDPHDSIALFCERALATDDTLTFDESDLETIDSICRQLDRIPLAIELAAARVRALSPSDVLARLDQRFALLTRNRTDGLEHQRALRSTVDWSYQLLNEEEQLLFDQISIFSGSFNLHAVESICTLTDGSAADSLKTLNTLTSLAEKSMVVVERKASGVRYRQLETLRQFGEEQLSARDSSNGLRLRHLQYYVSECENEQVRWFSAAQLDVDAILDNEWDNLRSAMAFALSTRQLDLGERLFLATVPYAVHRIRSEHGDWCDALIEAESNGLLSNTTAESGEAFAIGIDRESPEREWPPNVGWRLSAFSFGWAAWWSMSRGTRERTILLSELGQQRATTPTDPGSLLCKSMAAGALFLLGRQKESRELGREFGGQLTGLDPWIEYVLLRSLYVLSAPEEFAVHAKRLVLIAERFGAPSLIASARFYQGFAKLVGLNPDFLTAAALHREGVRLAQLAKAPFGESQNLQGLLEAKFALEADDALSVCSSALHRVHDLRHWVYLWRVVDITAFLLAKSGRFSEAALAVGHLEAHVPSWRPEPRTATKKLLATAVERAEQSLDDQNQAVNNGVALDRDSLVRRLIVAVDELEAQPGAIGV
jgi:predicted ATPase/DNA-binding SARP family transcriptional activator